MLPPSRDRTALTEDASRRCGADRAAQDPHRAARPQVDVDARGRDRTPTRSAPHHQSRTDVDARGRGGRTMPSQDLAQRTRVGWTWTGRPGLLLERRCAELTPALKPARSSPSRRPRNNIIPRGRGTDHIATRSSPRTPTRTDIDARGLAADHAATRSGRDFEQGCGRDRLIGVLRSMGDPVTQQTPRTPVSKIATGGWGTKWSGCGRCARYAERVQVVDVAPGWRDRRLGSFA